MKLPLILYEKALPPPPPFSLERGMVGNAPIMYPFSGVPVLA